MLFEQKNERPAEPEIMKTNEFIAVLRQHADAPLHFGDGFGHAVQAGYHLTEIKAAHFDTVDCGGETNRWNEAIVQLWVPEDEDDSYMTAQKFLKIFDKVSAQVPIDNDAELRIEYGDGNMFPSVYHVQSMTYAAGELHVLLEAPATTCKARDRRRARESVCCGQPEPACC